MIEGKSDGRSNIGYEDGEAIHANTDLIDLSFHDKPSEGWPYDRLIERERWRETTRCAAPLKSRGAALMAALGHHRPIRHLPSMSASPPTAAFDTLAPHGPESAKRRQ